MAGTRRRSRVSDTTKHAHHTSVSHTASALESNANGHVSGATTDNAADANDSPLHLEASSNRSTKGVCRNCKGTIGEFYNSWYRITGSYSVPALLGSYRNYLRRTGKQKAASNGTDIEGCTIQPLSCPATGCTDSPIGFTVVDAPAGKRNFRGRDFFKLSRIELQCEISPTTTITVEPQEDPAPELFLVEDPISPSSELASIPLRPSSDAMGVDPRSSTSYHHSRHEEHPEYAHQQRPPQPSLPNQQSLPSAASIPPTPMLDTVDLLASKTSRTVPPSPSPPVKPFQESHQPTRVPYTENHFKVTQENPSVHFQPQPSHESHQANGHNYPHSLRDVGLDAIERLQTQISQNSGALAAHTRDIRRGEESFQQLEETLRRDFHAQLIRHNGDVQRVDEAVARLHHEMQGMRQIMEGLSRELHLVRADGQPRAATVPPIQSISAQDSALELMAQQIAVMSQKANEIDTLRVTTEIMKNKIQRLEEGLPQIPSQSTPRLIPSPRAQIVQLAQPSPSTKSYHAGQAASPHVNASAQPPPHGQLYHNLSTPSSTAPPETTQRSAPVRSQSSGWTTVNAGSKRTYAIGVGSTPEVAVSAPGSPKRQRLGTAEPSDNYLKSRIYASGQPDTEHVEKSQPRNPTPAHTLPSQQSIPESAVPPQSQQPTYIPYGFQDGALDDSWHQLHQRTIEHRPRGRGRGGGPGSRGGRGRKSLPAQLHNFETSEWDRDDWEGVPDSQDSPDGYNGHTARSARGIARRGSGGGGGGGRGGYAANDRAVSLGLQGVTPGMNFGSPGDPYSHTKKTRTKPIRNADGVLIRKDGRPDMRSQSSAANLRKVYARREGDPSHSPTGFTPTGLQHSVSADVPDTPSPSPYPPSQDVTTSVHKKHNAIMDKMFPSGVDESRKRNDYTRQVFEDDHDSTVHARTATHRPVAKSSLPIKWEQVHQSSSAASQSRLQNEEEDRDRVESSATDSGNQGMEPAENSAREQRGKSHEVPSQVESELRDARTISDMQLGANHVN